MEQKIIELYKSSDFKCSCRNHALTESEIGRNSIAINGHYVTCEAKASAMAANQLLKARLGDYGMIWCPHPGCCCVCGHQKKCPEDGPAAVGLDKSDGEDGILE